MENLPADVIAFLHRSRSLEEQQKLWSGIEGEYADPNEATRCSRGRICTTC
jgi:hypothetical protein